jgi:hypothetical protein
MTICVYEAHEVAVAAGSPSHPHVKHLQDSGTEPQCPKDCALELQQAKREKESG